VVKFLSPTIVNLERAISKDALRVASIPVAQFVRLSMSPATEPYGSLKKAYRFDDPAQVYGVNYAGLEIGVAFAETILHKKGLFVDGEWAVSEGDIHARYLVRYARPANPILAMADLTGANLKALGLDNDVCASDDYTDSMHVSSTLYRLRPDLDGILYVSRQANRGLAVAMFDRSGTTADAAAIPLADHPDFNLLLSRFNVALLPSGRPPPHPVR
jgi:RES domain